MMNPKRIACSIVLLGLAIWLVVEHQGRLRLGKEITALREQLGQMASLVAENGGLSNLVAQAHHSQSLPDDGLKELTTLRGEVRVLRQQNKELESLRGEIYQIRTAMGEGSKAQTPSQATTADKGIASKASRLEILKAYYWTENAALDVTRELRSDIADDKLEAIASNEIKGDPDFGQVKTLTVVYRFDGNTVTNEFREGEMIVIPPE